MLFFCILCFLDLLNLSRALSFRTFQPSAVSTPQMWSSVAEFMRCLFRVQHAFYVLRFLKPLFSRMMRNLTFRKNRMWLRKKPYLDSSNMPAFDLPNENIIQSPHLGKILTLLTLEDLVNC
ncbi:hypothetical protein CEXT_431601 [Caerostris extrusa]|uniref:Secreted protein n=1 Tax=Caerostris extrusa TaxID=172846 RepID=A0AAV4NC80_CAEEX|nr:hypothetical protein CEXT_431601 [Caerostris extrusa]